MRWFFLLLLLSNVAFLAWQVWIAEPVARAPGTNVGMRPEHGLTLLTALPPEQRPKLRDSVEASAIDDDVQAVAPIPSGAAVIPAAGIAPAAEEDRPDPSDEKNPPVASAVCFQSDEYDSATELDSIAKVLSGYDIGAQERGHQAGEKVSFWVMLAPYASREKANEAAKMLQQRKVKDFFIIRSGQYENAVSLGVYSSMERAKRRADEIGALKLRLREPRIELRSKEVERHFLRFSVSSHDADTVLGKLSKRFPAATFKKIACK